MSKASPQSIAKDKNTTIQFKDIFDSRKNRRFLTGSPKALEFFRKKKDNFHLKDFDYVFQPNLENRKKQGLEEVLQDGFPITNQRAKIKIKYYKYHITYDPDETPQSCRDNGTSYEMNIIVYLRMEYQGKSGLFTKDFSVNMGQVPRMCPDGSLVINGVDRMMPAAIHRSPGALFLKKDGNANVKLAPHSGSWLYISCRGKELLAAVDKKKKFSVAALLWISLLSRELSKVIGGMNKHSEEEIEQHIKQVLEKNKTPDLFLDDFHPKRKIKVKNNLWKIPIDRENLDGMVMSHDVYHKGKLICNRGDFLQKKISESLGPKTSLCGLYSAEEIRNTAGEIVLKIGQVVEATHLEHINDNFTYYEVSKKYPEFVLHSLMKSKVYSPGDALDQWAIASDINTRGNHAKTLEKFHQLFGEGGAFDLHHIGTKQIFYKLKIKDAKRHLEYRVLVELIRRTGDLQLGIIEPEDIDHMSNKYLRGSSSAFLVQIQKYFEKAKKATVQKLYSLKAFLESDDFSEEKLPRKLSDAVNFKSCTMGINRVIFNSSYLVNSNSAYSRFAQSFKVTKDRQAGLQRRPTGNYGAHEIGRICCTKTSEGKNTGVTGYLTLGAKIDDGFILVPYHPVKNGIYDPNEIVYLSAREDMGKVLAFPTSYKENNQGQMVANEDQVWCIRDGNPRYYSSTDVQYVFVNSTQGVSFGVGMIPGIDSSYAYRLLVGSNMSDQALALINREKPFVVTGIETEYSGGIQAIEAGVVLRTDSRRIIVYNTDGKFDIYKLKNFEHTTSSTCLHYLSRVSLGQRVKKGETIAEDNNSKDNSLALGVNLRICFLSNGYTYEDAAVMNADLKYKGKLSHVASYCIECVVEDTRHGIEKTTNRIPRIPGELLCHLDESGIVNINTFVKGGTILVGKTIKGNRNCSDDQKFAQAITGRKNEDAQDVSLRMPEGCEGIVTKVTTQVSKRYEKNDRDLFAEQQLQAEMLADFEDTKSTLWEKFCVDFRKISGDLAPLIEEHDSVIDLLKNPKIKAKQDLLSMCNSFKQCIESMKKNLEIKIAKLREGYDLPDGVMKIIKVYVCTVKSVMHGDKFTNRAGNKCTVSEILERHEMPYDMSGRPMDAVFGQLSTISRCNFNQKIEAILGLCAHEVRRKLGDLLRELKMAPEDLNCEKRLRGMLKTITGRRFVGTLEQAVAAARHFLKNGFSWVLSHFRTLTRAEMQSLLAECKVSANGKMKLIDGKTGKVLQAQVAVGSQLIMKLIHMAEQKAHARDLGPYTASTDQPTGGKKRRGGQRQGEMETYTIIASGAPSVLIEQFKFRSGNGYGRKALAKAQDSGSIFSVLFENQRIGTGRAFYMFQKLLLAANIDLKVVPISTLREHDYKIIRNQFCGEKCAIIKLLGDKAVVKQSHGAVTLGKTKHYNQGRAEKHGFYCPVIFGHDIEYECLCGKTRGIHYLGSVCEECGVTVTNKKTRAERCGHIDLPVPMVHPIFIHNSSSIIASIIGISNKSLLAIKNAELYYVFEAGSSAFKVGDTITADVFDDIVVVCSDFVALTGGEAIKRLLSSVDLLKLIKDHREIAKDTNSEAVRSNSDRIINIANYMLKSGVELENIVFTKLTVIPVPSRKIHQLGGKQFAAPDSVMHYLSIFERIKRYMHCFDIFGEDKMVEFYPRAILIFLRRSIQDAIDLFFTSVANPNSKQQLVSLIHKISGKHGIPRNTLLGRRFNQSGRAVIAPNPDLEMDEVGVSVKMLSILYRGNVLRWLQNAGYAMNKREAILLVKSYSPVVRHVLEGNLKHMRILVTRQPSLHQYSTKALKPVIVGNKNDKYCTIGLHPMYCAAYNADFDGDTGQISALFSVEAKTEVSYFMHPSDNMLSTAISSNPVKRLVMKPDKDMIYGLYILTDEPDKSLEPMTVHHYRDAYFLHENNMATISQPIRFYDKYSDCWQDSTIGRLLFWNIVPCKHLLKFQDFNGVINNTQIAKIVIACLEYDINNKKAVAKFMDKVKNLGFDIANSYGGSFSYLDIPEIDEIQEIVKKKTSIEKSVIEQVDFGFISEKEGNRKIIDSWIAANGEMTICLNKYIAKNPHNPLFKIVKSGARGSPTQLLQIVGIIGISQAFDNNLTVIKSNYANGLSPIAVIVASASARGECMQVQGQTGNSGYMARKLAFMMNRIVVTELICNSQEVEYLENIFVDGQECVSVFDRAFGRTLGEDIEFAGYQFQKNTLITSQLVDLFREHGVYRIPVMSISGCTASGVCARCYGMNYSTGDFVDVGHAVGINCSHALSEPFSQMSLRSYHQGGRTNLSSSTLAVNSDYDGIVEFEQVKPVKIDGNCFNLGKNARIKIKNEDGACLATYPVNYGSKLLLEDGARINKEDAIFAMGKNLEIICQQEGVCRWDNLYSGVNARVVKRLEGDIYDTLSLGGKRSPVIIVRDNQGEEHIYSIPEGYLSPIKDGQRVRRGESLARHSLQSKKKLGLVTSLDRILSLLENRNPKQAIALLAPVDGVIHIKNHNDKIDYVHLGIKGEDEELINLGVFSRARLLLEHGDVVRRGESLTYGEPTLQDILTYRGIDACRNHLMGEICFQFNLNGALISPKHIDIVIRAMTSFYEVSIDPNFQMNTKRDIVVVNRQIIPREYIPKLMEHIKNNNKEDMKLKLKPRIFGIQQGVLKFGSILSRISFQYPKANIESSILLGSQDPANPQRLDGLESLQASLICNTGMPVGSNLVRRQFENMIKNDKKYQYILSKLSAMTA
jgi:DNA-directed RNA polymerase beta subunit/DNA-directed RNA polymerase beta' subunit